MGPDVVGGGPKTRVLIIEPERATDELRILIDLQDDLECVGVAASTAEGVELVGRVAPDVIVVDLPSGARGSGLAATVHEARPEARVIALTNPDEIDLLAEAAAAGAAGLLNRAASGGGEVLAAIRSISDGGVLIDQATLAGLVRLARTSALPRSPSPDAPSITAREREVLMLLADGLDLKTIARRLGISLHTTRGHVKKLFAKLGAHSQLEAVLAAARWGIVPVYQHPQTPVA